MTHFTEFDITEMQISCDAFNTIAGKDKENRFSDMQAQCELIKEELNETFQAIDDQDMEKILDGYVDLLVTVFGLGQKLHSLGCNTSEAMRKTAVNNISKFPSIVEFSVEDALKTVEMYADKGIPVTASVNANYGRWVFKDANGKVRKPHNFVSNDLKDCLPF